MTLWLDAHISPAIAKLLPAEGMGLKTNSKAQVGQLSAVSKARLSHKLGTVLPALTQQIRRKIKLHLDLG